MSASISPSINSIVNESSGCSPARVVDAFVETSNPKLAIESHLMNYRGTKLSSLGDEVSRERDVGNSTTTREQKMRMQQDPNKCSHPQPFLVRRQLSPSLAVSSLASYAAAASKFSYAPRPTERAYYQGLFNYVASFLNNGNNVSETSEVILPPKLVANKLFLASNLSSDRLRLIWNMATAIISSDNEVASSGCATEEAMARVSHLSEGDKKADVSLPSNAAGSQVTKGSSNAGSSRTSSSMIVMTQTQFNTAVRLIQLFQNHSTATDIELKKVDKSKLSNRENSPGKGAMMHGKLVLFDEDGLLPAYFEGVSGVILAIPGSKDFKLNGINKMTQRHVKDGFPFRRRSTDDGMVGAMNRRPTLEAQIIQVNDMNEQRVKQVEQQVILLTKTVRSLEIEVRHLKDILMKGAISRRISVVSSTDSKRCSDGAHCSNDVRVTGRRVNQESTSKTVGNKPHINKADSLLPRKDVNGEDEPNVGVESYWGKKEALEKQFCLSRSVQIDNVKARLAVKEGACFDQTINNDITPSHVSSNIPSVHPPAKHHSIPGQPKNQSHLQYQGPLHTHKALDPSSLKLSQSSTGSNSTSNSTGYHMGKHASFTPNLSQISAGNNSSTVESGDVTPLSHGFNKARSSRIFQPSHARNVSAQRAKLDQAESSVYSEQTALVSNGYSNIRHSHTNLHHTATSAAVWSSNDPSPTFLNTTRAYIRHTHDSQKNNDTKPISRLTKDSLVQSVRHIVRTKDGSTQVYSEKNGPPSTKALDLKPLDPAPTILSSNTRIQENEMIKKKRKMTRRSSTG